MNIPTREQVEEAVGMGAAAWDTIDPDEIIRAVLRLSIDQAALLTKDAVCEALRTALASVKAAGVPLANIAFNLAQQSGRTLDARECALFDACRKHWDAAIDAALVAAKGAK